MSRRELREHIFMLLFRVEFNSLEEMEEQVKLYFEEMEQPASEEDEEYIQKKFQNILKKLSEIDQLINEKAEKWNTSRMGKVELTIIRLAAYEMRHDEDVPVRVAINEAVELAKKYGQDESGSFVNGILAKMVEEEKDAGI
ncbi:transcription antitermination factor NusB [bacterium C-53]|nr:transcription antitermination factor NusB [Lachnospiraceae bacterium]NBI04673.1 transcription antitermination factor NusB [Lachnospiraceae bacterium]RKJ07896.1 transcription antitermination factor NusB [bacterium C-53]